MLEDTYGYSPIKKMFDEGDVYGIRYDEARAEKKNVRLGIIGTGGVAQSKHIPAIMRLKTTWEPVTFAAFSVRNEHQGEKVQEMYGVPWYPDYREMLDKERLDGVLVLSPDAVHFEHAMECMRRGINVLVEKPLTRSLTENKKLCEYADEHKLILMTVSNKRFAPPYLRAKEYMPENPAMISAKFNLGYDYVDILESGTIHIFDLVRYFMGDVAALSAVATKRYDFNRTDYPFDNACINLEFVSGAIGNIYTSSTALSLKPWERVEIYGEKQWLSVEDQCTLIVHKSEEGGSLVWNPVFPNTLLFDEEFGGYMGLIENFIECIRGNEQPMVTGWDGAKAYELVEATYRSLREGRRVRLPLRE